MRRECYALIKECLGNELFDALDEPKDPKALTKRGRPPVATDWFKEGLRQLYLSERQLSRSETDGFAVQMLYAYSYDVPARFLNGFLMVAGGREKIEQKIPAGFIEPGFEDLQKGCKARLKRAAR